MPVPSATGSPPPRTMVATKSVAAVLRSARESERAGCVPEAIERYREAIQLAERSGEATTLSEALRRLGAVMHQRGECRQARELCDRAHTVARDLGNDLLAAEALNTLGVMMRREGALSEARETLLLALVLGERSRELRARCEQNLGIVANIRGRLDEALGHYRRSLEQYEDLGDEHGCALAYHNLGMVSADQELFDDADRYFQKSLEIAERAGDVRLQALCLVNRADVQVARQRYADARQNAEAALVIFDQLDARDHKASAYRVIGIVYRETGRPALAESRLRSAIDLSLAVGSMLGQAEASHELALLYQAMGRNQDALALLSQAHQLFRQLDAQRDVINVVHKVDALETTYFNVVRDWGQSIESSDSYTFGHCERVADVAVAVAKTMGLDEHHLKLIRLGAYLHDLGKVKVPHEILNKPGPLTREEFDVMRMHPGWGVEMLDGVEFPWDLKPIIRWHHERYDGTGYPDRLVGDEIPVSAQIVGIADVYDALTTTRAYRAAMSHEQAVAEVTRVQAHWARPVFNAFIASLGSESRPVTAAAGDPSVAG